MTINIVYKSGLYVRIHCSETDGKIAMLNMVNRLDVVRAWLES